MTRLILIRHAESIPENNVPSGEWELSKKGETGVDFLLKNNNDIKDLGIIYSSHEKKAISTAMLINRFYENKGQPLKIKFDSRLNEINRSNGKYYSAQSDFHKAVFRSFSKFNSPQNDWESCSDALKRQNSFYSYLNNQYSGKNINIGIVSHGTVMTLYILNKAQKIYTADELFRFWQKIPFCGTATIHQNEIILDWDRNNILSF